MVNRILGEKIRESALKMPVIPVTHLPKGGVLLDDSAGAGEGVFGKGGGAAVRGIAAC
jgi:hypothetical protein